MFAKDDFGWIEADSQEIDVGKVELASSNIVQAHPSSSAKHTERQHQQKITEAA